jgi:hypothetical protein
MRSRRDRLGRAYSRDRIVYRLERDYSPDRIVHRLERDYSWDRGVTVWVRLFAGSYRDRLGRDSWDRIVVLWGAPDRVAIVWNAIIRSMLCADGHWSK